MLLVLQKVGNKLDQRLIVVFAATRSRNKYGYKIVVAAVI
jgi:hypothetical protein